MAEPVSITHEPSRSPSGTNAMDQRPMQARIYGHLRKPACQQSLYLVGSTRSTPWKSHRGFHQLRWTGLNSAQVRWW